MLHLVLVVINGKGGGRTLNPFLFVLELGEAVGSGGVGSAGERLVAAGRFQGGVIPPVGEIGDEHAERGPDRHVVDVVAVIFTPRYRDQGRSDQRRESNQDPREVGSRSENVHLAGEHPCP